MAGEGWGGLLAGLNLMGMASSRAQMHPLHLAPNTHLLTRAHIGLSREAGVSVEAFVVTVRGAAGPDCQGLLQPLLKRWQAGRYGHTIFGLPAVQVGCRGGGSGLVAGWCASRQAPQSPAVQLAALGLSRFRRSRECR